VLVRQNWLEAYDFTTKRGSQFLGDYVRRADPFADIGERTVSVQVTSVVRASDRSFQVKWTETTHERGAEAGTSRWTAILTVVIKPPRDADTLRRNPLGVYVDAVDWSRELDPPTPTPTTPRPSAPPPSTPTVPTGVPLGSPLDPNLAAPAQPAQESRP
jgi:type IV secretion system protein TrbF